MTAPFVLERRPLANPAVHAMAVIVVQLFAFHGARLSGFTPGALALALGIATLAAASLALKREVVLHAAPKALRRRLVVAGLVLREASEDLSAMAWTQVRPEMPDLLLEAGRSGGTTVPLMRFKNAFGGDGAKALAMAAKVAQFLHIEDRGYREHAPSSA